MAASVASPVVRGRAWTSKHTLFTIFGLAFAAVFVGIELPLLLGVPQIWEHFNPAKMWMIPHGIAGATALLLGPLQFSNRLRAKYLKLHRVVGRFYMGGALIAAVMSVPMVMRLGPPELLMAAVTQSTGWVVCAGIAIYCIKKGKVELHRQWMMRSYPFAMVFVASRILHVFVPSLNTNLPFIVQEVWVCIFLAAFVPELVLHLPAVFAKKPQSKNAAAAATSRRAG